MPTDSDTECNAAQGDADRDIRVYGLAATVQNNGLNLGNIGLSDVHFAVIGELFSFGGGKRAGVKFCYLGYNKIGDELIPRLVEAFQQNQTLVTLLIQSNGITSAGAQQLADLLEQKGSLPNLKLFYVAKNLFSTCEASQQIRKQLIVRKGLAAFDFTELVRYVGFEDIDELDWEDISLFNSFHQKEPLISL